MSITQSYYLAHTARAKLSKEAARGDHDLRLLVGHANLLDGLMIDLSNAEQEQESWFNQTVNNHSMVSEEPKHVQWVDTIPEEVEGAVEEDFYAESDGGSDSDDEQSISLGREPQVTTSIITADFDVDEEMEDADYEDDLALTRTSSEHPSEYPPELLHEDEDESESEDDSVPLSPPLTETPLHALSEKQRQAIATTSFYQPVPVKTHAPTSLPEPEQAFYDEGFYLPQRQQTMIANF